MKLPINYVELECEEMRYVEGGAYGQIKVKKAYLSKWECASVAAKYAGKKLSDGNSYSKGRIAAEIYAHAVLYYSATLASSLFTQIHNITGLSSSAINSTIGYIKTHSNPIDLGGDNWGRVAFYTVLFSL